LILLVVICLSKHHHHHHHKGVDVIFQGILFASSAAFFLGAVFQTPTMAFGISVIVQMCVGGYWPSVGYLRGRYVVPELRVTFLTISRYYNKQYSNHK
jgi:hypothetical protein